MSTGVHSEPVIVALAKALGLVDGDGAIDAGWLEHPLARIRGALANDTQRSALLELLESLLPSEDGAAPAGARWHPLLDENGRGNVYVTVEGDVLGVAARLGTPAGQRPAAHGIVALPLISTANGTVRAIAGAPQDPLELGLDVAWDGTTHPSGLSVRATVDTIGGAAMRVAIEDVDAGSGPQRLEFDPARLDHDGTRVVTTLLRAVLKDLAATDPRVQRVVDHLPGLLGLDRPDPLPLQDLLRDPAALRGWLAGVAHDASALQAWFADLVALLGGSVPAGAPQSLAGGPLRARLLDLGPASGLDLELDASPDAATSITTLTLGIRLQLAAGPAQIEGGATIVALPLGGTAPAAVLPQAQLQLRAPGGAGPLVDAAPAIKITSLRGGVRWDGARVAPALELTGVTVEGRAYAALDLTSAAAVIDAASTGVRDALASAIGGTGVGRNLQALLGLVAPGADPASPHALSLAEFAANPTRALGEFHRALLADATRSWGALFAELAAFLRLPTAGPPPSGPEATAAALPAGVTGTGSAQDPWRVRIAGVGLAELQLAAWDARGPATPAGTHLLRIGLRLTAHEGAWSGAWLAEVLGFDLAPAGAGGTRLLGGQHVSLALAPLGSTTTPLGAQLAAAAVTARADWTPGGAFTWDVAATGTSLVRGTATVGPFTLHVPPAGSFDPGAPDLGLGLPVNDVLVLVRALIAEALMSWGGLPLLSAGALVGLHREIPELPPDWPLLQPPDPANVGSLFADPLTALRRQLEGVVRDKSAGGVPFSSTALALLSRNLGGFTPPAAAAASPAIAGAGARDEPWAIRLGSGAVEGLVWLEPAGSAAAWIRHLAAQLDGVGHDPAALLALLPTAGGAVPEAAAALRGRVPAAAADALQRLQTWLASSDGIVPTASQTAVSGPWQVGATVTSAHPDQPANPAAIAQIRTQLDAWAGGATAPRTVLLLGPPFSDHRAWSAYLAAAEPGRSPQAHLDLRAPGNDPLTVDLSDVTAIATHYTADLADASAGLQALTAQLDRVVERVRALKNATGVFLVAHSTAGVVARAYAAAHPDRVAGVITLGTPHAGTPLSVLADEALADAARLARGIAGDAGATPVLRAIAFAASVLDGWVPLPSGRPTPLTFPTAAFAGIPKGTVDTVRGLAIPGALGGDLIGELAPALAARALATLGGADRAGAADLAPAQACFGLRARLGVPAAAAGGIAVDARVRLDLGAIALAPGAAPSTDTPRASVIAAVECPGQWLTGRPDADGPDGVRIRRAELGAVLSPATGGGTTCTPVVRLHDALAGTPAHAIAELEDVLARLPGLPDRLPLRIPATETGTPAALLRDALTALALCVDDGKGGRLLDLPALAAIAARPAAEFAPRAAGLLSAVVPQLGGQATLASAWAFPVPGAPFEVAVTRDPWTVRLHGAGADGLALADGIAATVDARVTLPQLAPAAEAVLRLGAARVSWTSTTRTLQVAAPPWLEPVALLPAPAPGPVGDALAGTLPGVLLALPVTAALDQVRGAAARARALPSLLASPSALLLRPDALGTPDGKRLDATRISQHLQGVARRLGLDASAVRAGDGILLPGGVRLSAQGTDPVEIVLAGLIKLGSGPDELGFSARARVSSALDVTPAGGLTLKQTLPGSWGAISAAWSADPAGLALTVTPTGVEPIVLLPHFGGFGALAAAAVRLLPHALQRAVLELRRSGTQRPLLEAVLKLAAALGIYGEDADGFERPDRAAELTRMGEPGWLASKAPAASSIVPRLADILGAAPPPAIAAGAGTPGQLLPAGVTIEGDRVKWTRAVAGGTVGASVGFAGGEPTLAIETAGVALGPVTADAVRLGYESGVHADVALRLAAPAPLAFLRPALQVGVAGGRFSAEALPLGPGTGADLRIKLAPDRGVTAGPAGPRKLLEAWGVPLVGDLLLRAFGDKLDRPLWTGGPTARAALVQAGLIPSASGVAAGTLPIPVVVPAPPPLPELGLRGLRALATGVTLKPTPTLALSVVNAGGRQGLRLSGHQDVEAGELVVSVRFGDAAWLDDPAAGVTLFLLQDATGQTPPVRIAPSLSVAGLGAVVTGDGRPLLDGTVRVRATGGLLFFDASFLDASGNPKLAIANLGAGAEIDDAQVILSASDGDSFLAEVLPPQLAAPFSLAVAFRQGTGLRISGGSQLGGNGLRLGFPLDVDLVVAHLDELLLGLTAGGGKARAEAAISAGVDLGPIHGSVQHVGVAATFGHDGRGLRFRPPDGVAVSVDASVVTGGGFLFFDEAQGQYAGGLELELHGIALTAVALLVPEGPAGFSLLVLISVHFPPIQLGFGFALTGIGGLIGINRTVALQALRDGLQEGSLDSILFPSDLAANATRVVADLTRFFPAASDQYVIGPTVEITWGGGILTAMVGLFIEAPSPVRLVLAGRLRLALPAPQAPIADIRMDLLGSLDFTAGRLEIDAVLRNSRVAAFTITGQAALRASWLTDPAFLLSIGGFHPRFTPPANFPVLQRVAISLTDSRNPRVRLEAYLALTSNTLQVGARLDLYAGADIPLLGTFAVEAGLSFDALFQFDPFMFTVDISAWVMLTWNGDPFFGLRLDLSLSGPRPWHARGTATFEFLGTHSIGFEFTIGKPAPVAPPVKVDLLPKLVDALAAPQAWTADLPERGRTLVTLAAPASTPQGLVVHPLGVLSVRQSVVPLDQDLDRFGEARLKGARRFSLSATFGADDRREPLDDSFAPSQFRDMTEAQKLAAPSFEPMHAGLRLGAPGASFPAAAMQVAAVALDTRILTRDPADPSRRVLGDLPTGTLPEDRVLRQVSGSAAAVAGAVSYGPAAYANVTLDVAVVPPTFAVVDDRTLAPLQADGHELSFIGTYSAADELRRTLARTRGGVEVVESPDAFAPPIPPAVPDVDPGAFYLLTALHSKKPMEVAGTSLSEGAPIQQRARDLQVDQYWRFEPLQDGTYRVIADVSGLALDVAGGASAAGSRVVQARRSDTAPSQRWSIVRVDVGRYRLECANGGHVLDVTGGPQAVQDGAPLQLADWIGATNQTWQLTVVSEAQVLRERIRVRAYFLWTARGRPLGQPVVDWLNAEREVLRPVIAREAYYRYERRGRAPGGAVSDWLAAETDVKALVVSAAAVGAGLR